MKFSLTVSPVIGAVSAEYILPDAAKCLMTLAHGAGAGMDHPFTVTLATELAKVGIATLRFDFPFTEHKKGRPDTPAVAHETIAAVIRHASSEHPSLRLFASGKSFGGREDGCDVLAGQSSAGLYVVLPRMMKIAYVTYRGSVKYSAANGFNEFTDLLPFLQQKGLDIEAAVWDDPSVDWTKYTVALLKTPWDYHDKPDAFVSWLDRIEGLNIRLLNDFALVRWNMDKHYLQDIAAAGFPVIPSVFLDKGWKGDLAPLFERLQAERLIIKPCVSGGSKDTIVVGPEDAAAVAALLEKGDFIAQPLMSEVQEGEWSYLFFNGRFSHAILKKPKDGDFRVQQIYGGSIQPLHPSDADIETAAAFVRCFAQDSLYARVDGLMVDGRFVLMELELIEPYLYLSYGDQALERYYRALAECLDQFVEMRA